MYSYLCLLAECVVLGFVRVLARFFLKTKNSGFLLLLW